MRTRVEVKQLSKSYGTMLALDHVSLAINAGEYAVLLGPSGCGKTTLLNIIAGFVSADQGHVLVGSDNVTNWPPQRRPTTTVFQDYALFPHMTLAQNVSFGLRMSGAGRRERARRTAEMLELVGLEGAAGRRPHELSGGQRQRVALARALAVAPRVLLLDEPLGALDVKLRRQMQEELKAIQMAVGTTFIHVTHDQEEAMAIADRIIVMNEGRIEDQGTPERIYLRPVTRFAATFMGDINLVEASVAGDRLETLLGSFPAVSALPNGSRALVGIRPEHLMQPDGVELCDATVGDVSFFGSYRRVHLSPTTVPDLVLTAHLPQSEPIRSGEVRQLSVNPKALIVLPNQDEEHGSRGT